MKVELLRKLSNNKRFSSGEPYDFADSVWMKGEIVKATKETVSVISPSGNILIANATPNFIDFLNKRRWLKKHETLEELEERLKKL